MDQELIALTGTLEKIVYSKPEEGFLIGIFREEGSSVPITIKGTLYNVNESDLLQIRGRWENHKVYGRQFGVSEFMPVLPQSLEGIERYLASGVFKGIGKATAQRIVKKYGTDTFKIIDESPKELLTIPRFTKKQLKGILDAHDDQKTVRESLSFLHSLGITATYAQKIFNHYGISCIPLIQNNPYQLTDIQGIGFLIADSIARKLGFDENSIERAVSGTLYMLDQLAAQGHTCYPSSLLIEKIHQEFHIAVAVLESALEQLLKDHLLKVADRVQHPLGPPLAMISRTAFYYAEQRIAENLYRILSTSGFTHFTQETELIKTKETQMGITLDFMQHKAIEAALKYKVLIITGGPGTGKTTIIQFILNLMRSHIPGISLAAPTGRAAKRLSETTRFPATTMHRLLEAGKDGFARNQDHELESELLIIDETSMIDTLLADCFLRAVPSSSRLIFVGDVDQLPSVGAGTVLLDLIHSAMIPVIRLETVFRQAKDSLITTNAHCVRKGKPLNLRHPSSPEQLQDFYFIPESEPELVVEKIITMVTDRIPTRFQLDPKLEIQVLTPMHRGVTGTVNLNQRLQSVLNNTNKQLLYREQLFKVGDKVMQQQNSYEKGVFNGDVGIILDCDVQSQQIIVEFDHEVVTYESGDLEQITLAYAISVHKSQGSEYPSVILPLTAHHYVMLQRNLLYTAITRGKQLVVIIGTEKALQLAINNANPSLRYTGLLSRLKSLTL